MKKKLLALMLAALLTVSLAACGGEKEESGASESGFESKIDLEFTKDVMTTISNMGDDEATGNRSSGSPAEKETAEYLKSVMEDIGLQNITVDKTTVDGWTFKGANLTYKDGQGEEQAVTLGGYATDLTAKQEKVKLVYLGEGTEADYEGVDVKGKLVLIDINQDENWWINYPAYQAKRKGAKAVIAMSQMVTENENRIGSQDICGPADAPAFAISQKDSKALQEAIKASKGKELDVIFNADSTITKDAESQNVWGEIPGKSDQVIYMIGHYDGYYHSLYDNASGIATTLGIVKALIDSGYTPEKTIRVVAHGAEEFGKSGSEYDWATGAYEQIMTNHPEWAEKAFAVVNIDGDYPVVGEKGYGINTSHEILPFVMESAEKITGDSDYEYAFRSPAGTGTEDFQWTAQGIPSIVATHGDECIYYDGMYHSNMDSEEGGALDEEALMMNHRLFGTIVSDLDKKVVRPMDFTARLEALEESLDEKLVGDKELTEQISAVKEKAAALNETIATADKGEAADAEGLNDQLYKLFLTAQDGLLRIDYGGEVVFPNEMYQNNINALSQTIAELKKGNIQTAYDEYLSGVDWAWYSMYFDKQTCKYFENQLMKNRKGTFGEGRIDYPMADTDSVVRSLSKKYDSKNADVSKEIKELNKLKKQQEAYLKATIDKEKETLTQMEEAIDKMI